MLETDEGTEKGHKEVSLFLVPYVLYHNHRRIVIIGHIKAHTLPLSSDGWLLRLNRKRNASLPIQ